MWQHTFYPSTQEAGVGRSEFEANQAYIHISRSTQNKNKKQAQRKVLVFTYKSQQSLGPTNRE